jgi:hypothetical protein
MAMSQDHINQWKHNRAFIATIDPGFPDWAVTAAFYTAVHAVDALLKKDEVSGIVSHEARNRTLMNTNKYARIWRLYRPLYALSQVVRYDAAPRMWIPWQMIDAQVLRCHLYPLEASVRKLMGGSDDLPPIALKAMPA